MGLWPTREALKALRPLTATLSPFGGEGVSALISWFLLATDYWLLATFRSSGMITAGFTVEVNRRGGALAPSTRTQDPPRQVSR